MVVAEAARFRGAAARPGDRVPAFGEVGARATGERVDVDHRSARAERVDPDRPPGANNPLLQTIELDSMPGFSFTATGGPVYAAVVHKAQQDHRKVEIAYTPSGPQSGKIISVKLK